ncbi:hypothetical protein [Nostoc commune]|uniref:hypothetical protein n=1 Tax=Nostoc commune TaxID=1178 RepID=UPI001C629D89|nr:hypothetical protein [Nostoc commune]
MLIWVILGAIALNPTSCQRINPLANSSTPLKRTKTLVQSSLEDFSYEIGCDNSVKCKEFFGLK